MTKKEARATAELVSQFAMKSIQMLECSCRQPKLRDHKIPQYVSIPAKVQIKNDPGARILAAEIQFSLFADYEQREEGDPDTSAISIQATYVAVFEHADGIPEEQLSFFGSSVCGPMLWPYWRQFAQYMTQQLGLPPLTVPLLNIQSFLAEVEKSAKKRIAKPPRKRPAKKIARRQPRS